MIAKIKGKIIDTKKMIDRLLYFVGVDSIENGNLGRIWFFDNVYVEFLRIIEPENGFRYALFKRLWSGCNWRIPVDADDSLIINGDEWGNQHIFLNQNHADNFIMSIDKNHNIIWR
jgi:hypothetical protein